MGWFEKLKKVIEINKINIKINMPISLINITKDSNRRINEETGHYYDVPTKILHLHLDKIPLSLKKEFPEIIQDYIKEKNRILEIDAKNILEKLYQYNRENPNKNILAFFKDIIPSTDYETLNSSLFLRDEFRKGNNINQLKADIRKRFGDRGNNISNLCTAGYFEEFLMPMYNSSKEEFHKLYEIIVSKSIMAIFVHARMELEDISTEITSKLQLCKQYGIKFIHIHGIGKMNIEKIKKCIEEQKEDFNFFEKKIYESEKEHIIVVELLFK